MSSRTTGSGIGNGQVEVGHVPALDGVRGLAILGVMASHLLWSSSYSVHPFIQVMMSVRNLLWTGVTLFFALSGFLITGILYDTLGSENYFRTFFGRRVLRIFPLYYGVLGVLLLLTHPLHFDWHGQAYRLLTYTPDVPFARMWDSDPSPYINLHHFWSLAVEEQFYLLWPLMVLWLRDWRKIFLATMIGAGLSLAVRLTVQLVGYGPGNHTLPNSMDALLFGGALALLVRSRHRDTVTKWGLPVFLVAAAISWAGTLTHPISWEQTPFQATAGMTVVALGMTGLVAASLRIGSVVQAVCSWSVFRWFGRYSYGLYVFHYSVDQSLTFPIRLALEGRGVYRVPAIFASAFVVGTISCILAVMSYHLYEKHFLQLKRYFPYRKKVLTEELEFAAPTGAGLG